LRDDVLRRAQFITHNSLQRPQFNSERLLAIGAGPVHFVRVDNATYYLSQPFALDESHQVAVALVEVQEAVTARILYRSNSQFSWRLCDAMRDRHIGKGFHEFDKQMPIAITISLLGLADAVGVLKSVDGFSPITSSQSELAKFLRSGLTADFASGREAGDVIVNDANYVTKEYKDLMPLAPVPFSLVKGWLPTAGGGTVADPGATTLPQSDKLPDFSKCTNTVRYRNPAYARVTRGDGMLTAKVFLSMDGTVRYLFFEDSEGHAVMSGAEIVDVPINRLGLRCRYLDVRGMDAPLMEYAFQMPIEFGGRRQDRYKSNWPLVQQQPIIQHYLKFSKSTL
jgi:hypothetical protein